MRLYCLWILIAIFKLLTFNLIYLFTYMSGCIIIYIAMVLQISHKHVLYLIMTILYYNNFCNYNYKFNHILKMIKKPNCHYCIWYVLYDLLQMKYDAVMRQFNIQLIDIILFKEYHISYIFNKLFYITMIWIEWRANYLYKMIWLPYQ